MVSPKFCNYRICQRCKISNVQHWSFACPVKFT